MESAGVYLSQGLHKFLSHSSGKYGDNVCKAIFVSDKPDSLHSKEKVTPKALVIISIHPMCVYVACRCSMYLKTELI